MKATKGSISTYFFYVLLLSFVTTATGQQDSILIISSQDSISNNQQPIIVKEIDSANIIIPRKIIKNQPPVIVDTIPTILINEDENMIIELSSFYSFISDPDDSISNLQWKFLPGN